MPEPTAQPRILRPPVIVAAEEEPEEATSEAPAAEQSPAEDEIPDEVRFPVWAKIPGLKIPPGRKLWFIALDVGLMARSSGGQIIELPSGPRKCRQLLIWELNLGDRKLAFKRAAGDSNQAADELAIQMIRAIDGQPIDWANMKSPAYPPRIWADIGNKLRDMLHKLYATIHVLQQKELEDFFANCVEVRTAAST